MVETAFSLLILIGLLLAVIEGSMAVYSYHYLANAAHEATRYAIVRGGDWATSCDGNSTAGSGYGSSMCTASPSDIANYVANRNFPGIRLTASNVCVQYFSSVPASPSARCTASTGAITANVAGDVVQVTIIEPFTFFLPGIGTYNYNLASTSQMVIAQ